MRTTEQVQAEYTWLSPAEFGRRFGGASAEFVREMIARGEVRALNLNDGGRRPEYRIPHDELDRLLKERMVGAGTHK